MTSQGRPPRPRLENVQVRMRLQQRKVSIRPSLVFVVVLAQVGAAAKLTRLADHHDALAAPVPEGVRQARGACRRGVGRTSVAQSRSVVVFFAISKLERKGCQHEMKGVPFCTAKVAQRASMRRTAARGAAVMAATTGPLRLARNECVRALEIRRREWGRWRARRRYGDIAKRRRGTILHVATAGQY